MPAEHYLNAEKLTPFVERLKGGKPTVMIALGDSNTCNHVFTDGTKQWPELLHTELQRHYDTQYLTLINRGVCGDTAAMGLARLEEEVVRHKPHLTIVTFGSNDVGKSSPDEFVASMDAIVKKLADSGGIVVLKTIAPLMEMEPSPPHLWKKDFGHREMVQRTRLLAAKRGLPLVDIHGLWSECGSRGVLDIPRLMHDAVHTNANGHRLIARQTLPLFGLQPTLHFDTGEHHANA